MRRITLSQDTRTFQKVDEDGRLLFRTGGHEDAGASLLVSEPVLMTYDHRDQLAVYFKKDGEELFLLVSELGLDGFVQ